MDLSGLCDQISEMISSAIGLTVEKISIFYLHERGYGNLFTSGMTLHELIGMAELQKETFIRSGNQQPADDVLKKTIERAMDAAEEIAADRKKTEC